MNFPDDLKYTDHDEWVRVDGDLLTLGISDFAQDQLGELVHIELPEVGAQLSAGDVACEVESVKAVAEVYAPVDGEVVEVNEALDGAEDTVNEDPYGSGWLLRMKISDPGKLSTLLDAGSYRQRVASA
ncbi:MAG: glycine cleavage system protein GcvH [Deltaproteobacteria bacterium]|nr:MAG: glycine cleavage system protein GcvH [Deltaproteobacteria bacterium]